LVVAALTGEHLQAGRGEGGGDDAVVSGRDVVVHPLGQRDRAGPDVQLHHGAADTGDAFRQGVVEHVAVQLTVGVGQRDRAVEDVGEARTRGHPAHVRGLLQGEGLWFGVDGDVEKPVPGDGHGEGRGRGAGDVAGAGGQFTDLVGARGEVTEADRVAVAVL